jgi:hypothetical protein
MRQIGYGHGGVFGVMTVMMVMIIGDCSMEKRNRWSAEG